MFDTLCIKHDVLHEFFGHHSSSFKGMVPCLHGIINKYFSCLIHSESGDCDKNHPSEDFGSGTVLQCKCMQFYFEVLGFILPVVLFKLPAQISFDLRRHRCWRTPAVSHQSHSWDILSPHMSATILRWFPVSAVGPFLISLNEQGSERDTQAEVLDPWAVMVGWDGWRGRSEIVSRDQTACTVESPLESTRLF